MREEYTWCSHLPFQNSSGEECVESDKGYIPPIKQHSAKDHSGEYFPSFHILSQILTSPSVMILTDWIGGRFCATGWHRTPMRISPSKKLQGSYHPRYLLCLEGENESLCFDFRAAPGVKVPDGCWFTARRGLQQVPDKNWKSFGLMLGWCRRRFSPHMTQNCFVGASQSTKPSIKLCKHWVTNLSTATLLPSTSK